VRFELDREVGVTPTWDHPTTAPLPRTATADAECEQQLAAEGFVMNKQANLKRVAEIARKVDLRSVSCREFSARRMFEVSQSPKTVVWSASHDVVAHRDIDVGRSWCSCRLKRVPTTVRSRSRRTR